MFHYTVIAIGKMKNRSLAMLCDDFSQRLKRQGKFELIELKDGDVESEGLRILEALAKRSDARIYAMAEEGTTRTSQRLSDELYALQGRPAIFIFGGAYGLSHTVKARADALFPSRHSHSLTKSHVCSSTSSSTEPWLSRLALSITTSS